MLKIWLLGGGIALSGAMAVGKPPELPVNPQVQGKEHSPMCRDHHNPDVETSKLSFPLPMPQKPPEPKRLLASDWRLHVADVVYGAVAVPLGLVDE